MFIFYTVLGLVMLWLLYNLMGHQSKVEYKAKWWYVNLDEYDNPGF